VTATTPPPDAKPPRRHPEAPPPGAILGSHYDKCFACGEVQEHGLRMQVSAGEGVSVRAEFTVAGAHQGAPGLAHGGVLTAALDEAMGSVLWLLRTVAVTGRLEADFLAPVPVGSTLHLTATCEAVVGRKIYVSADGRLDAPDGPVAVRATSVFIEVALEHFIEHGRQSDVREVMANPDRVRASRAFEINP
jgi:acyl-coenzyme A thioesterase PaaI-like protein